MSGILLAYACGLIDRFRGDKVDAPYSKTVEALIYGLVVGVLIGLNYWQAILFAGLWATGASFGWGTPLGAMLVDKEMEIEGNERWQFWIFKEKVVPACILRGVIWGACVLPIVYFNIKAGVFLFVMGAIFPLAIWAAKRFPYITTDSWARQEFYRGWMVGAVALLLGLI